MKARRRQTGAGQAHGGRTGRPRRRRCGLGGHGPSLALHGRDGLGMDMGLGPIESFAATWVVMMAAMMLPSAIPVVLEFARTAEGRQGMADRHRSARRHVPRRVAAVRRGVLRDLHRRGNALAQPDLVAGLALALAGVYSVSPIKRASQARCRELCALHGPLPFNLMRSAVVAGARYGLSCLGCSAALMVAMVLIGMSSLWWAVILGSRRPRLQARASAASAI